VSDPVAELRRDYVPLFLSFLTRQSESGLNAAYELGRRSMDRNVGLLDLVRVHNDVYLELVGTVRTAEDAQRLARAASAFLFEALASFEMTQRGFMAGDGLESQPHSHVHD
jgi:Phosphoserine phosphatase RsbU, N-terminal domain